jgi:NADP-dependent 3-hydroxy acid dehydrogenase YdfG
VEIEDAYRSLQKGQHIGKLVVRMPADHTLLPAAKPYDRLRLRPDASYLIVGGLGGLGRGVATWLAEHGARNLIFLSRSGMGKNLKASTSLVEELTAMGCDAQIFAGSVTSLEDVRRTIVKANKPIAGVIQMSMVLRDAAFAQMTHRDWEEATAPKVQGTWNLHTAFAEHKLEFMVLFASISGSIGNPGQANYAAANTFLDAFVQFRHHKGLAASVLDIGVMGDVGYVSQDQAMLNYFSSRAAWILEEQDLLDSLQLAIKRSIPEAAAANGDDFVNPSQIGIGVRMTKPVLSPENRATWKRDIRMSAYRNLEQEMGSETTSSTCEGDDKLNVFLEVAASDPQLLLQDSSIVLVAEQVGTTLLSFMMKPSDELDVSLSPAAMGIDSLVATELRTWLRQRLRLEVSVLEIIGAASIHALSKSLLKGLLIKFGTVGKGV